VDIRRLRDEGLYKCNVAEVVGVDRKTVAKYWDGPTEEPETPRYKKRQRKIDPYMDYITARLEKWPQLSAERLYQEIVAMGYEGSRRSVRRAVAEVRPRKKREYKPFETLPGEQAQVDWGHMGRISIDGAELPLYCFAFTLAWSRVRYVEFITSLNMATFLGCMHRALSYINGVPREVVFDNAKTVVAERVGGVVRYNEDLLRMAATYGFQPKACWVNDPESKGKVESTIGYIKRGFYYGRDFAGPADLNVQALQWCNEVANRKVHATTGEVPFDRLEQERAYLKPLNVTDPLFIIEERRATKTQLISVEGNQYSVPPIFAQRKVRYRRFDDRIELLHDDEVVDTIPLMSGRGHRRIEDRHYPAHMQKPERARHPLQAGFEALAPSAKEYLRGLSQHGPGNLREQMEQIVALAECYSVDALEQAMQRSVEFQVFGYGRLKRILERQEKVPQTLRTPSLKVGARSNELAMAAVGVEQRDLRYYGGDGQ
jgi:transposase